jgi:membrane protein implicated in regulation of membrane protease activity
MIVSPVLIWFLVGIGCFLVEMALPGFILFFFGIGAWCVALALVVTALSLSGQLLVFLGCSLVSLVLLRAKLRTVFQGSAFEEEDSMVIDVAAATGEVTDDIIPPASGRVKYGGSFWNAVADKEIKAGTVVDIVEKNDLTVKVCPLKAGKESNNE